MQSPHLYSHFNPTLAAYKDNAMPSNVDFPYSPCRMQQPTPSFFANHQNPMSGYMTASPTQASVFNTGMSPSPEGPTVNFGPTAVSAPNAPGMNTTDGQHLFYPSDAAYSQYPWIKSSEAHWWPSGGITGGIFGLFFLWLLND